MAIRKYVSVASLLAALAVCLAATAFAAKPAASKSQTINFTSTAPANATIGGPTYTVTATGGGSGEPVVLTIDAASASVCKLSGNTTGSSVSFQAAGTCTIDANQKAKGEFTTAPQAQQSFAVAKKSQTIAFSSTAPSSATVGGPTYTVTASGGGSGNAVKFTIDAVSSSVCAISGATVSFTGAGTCTIDANQEGNASYSAAPQAQQAFSVGKGSQAITFTSAAPSSATVGGPTYTVTATGGPSGNPVKFAIDAASSSVCTIAGATVSFTGGGTCTIDANQEGNPNYNPAPQTHQSFGVAKRSQTITIESKPPSPALVGETYTVKATASSGLPVSISSGPSAICTASGSTVSFVSEGECKIEAKQEGNGEYSPAKTATQSFGVIRRSQTITFKSTPPNPALVGGIYTAEATASSGLSVSLSSGTPSVCSVSGSEVKFLTAGECTINASQAGSAEYEPAQEHQSFIVGKRSQTITFKTSPPNPDLVGGSYPIEASASSGLVVSLSAGPTSVCSLSGSTVKFVGEGECKVEAKQEGNAEYGAAKSETQLFTVHQRGQTITFTSNPPTGATVGGSYAMSATASSGLPVSFSSATPTVCTVSASTVSFVGAGTCTVDANQAGNGEYAPAPQVQQSFAVGAAPSPSSPPISPGPIVEVKPVVIPNSSFKVLGATLSLATYVITFTESVADPGTFTWVLTFENGKFGVYAASAKCKVGTSRLKGRCRPVRALFAKGSETVASPGSVTFMVRPTSAGVKALKKAFKQGKGLPVTAYVTFQSSHGGAPISRVQSLIVKGRR